MTALEVLLLAFVLIFLVVVLMRMDRQIKDRKGKRG